MSLLLLRKLFDDLLHEVLFIQLSIVLIDVLELVYLLRQETFPSFIDAITLVFFCFDVLFLLTVALLYEIRLLELGRLLFFSLGDRGVLSLGNLKHFGVLMILP